MCDLVLLKGLESYSPAFEIEITSIIGIPPLMFLVRAGVIDMGEVCGSSWYQLWVAPLLTRGHPGPAACPTAPWVCPVCSGDLCRLDTVPSEALVVGAQG